MAMEKLILRSVLYGADKIPDKWFERVPGGFFREKEGGNRNSDSPSSDRRKNNKNARRPYDEDDEDYDEGYRSEGHGRRHQRNRSSYDGGADDGDYYLSGDEQHRHRSGKSHRRRHSTEDDQRGHGDGRHRSHRKDPRDSHDPAFNPYRRRDLRSPDLYYDRERPLSSGDGSDRSANRFSMGSSAAAAHPPYQRSSATQSPAMQSPNLTKVHPARSGSIGNGYVPYANIYGQDIQQTARQPRFSPVPASPMRAPQPYSDPRNSPPVAPPPHDYHQNPFAQEAPIAADAGAGAVYTGTAGFVNQEQDPRWTNGPDPNYSARLYTRYDENNDPNPNPASPRRSSRRDHSPSYDSYDTRTQDRRSRSERRTDDKPKPAGKSKSRVREAFDTSQRGLGYGAVGAVTGGLVGSEFGKGAIPRAIGATVGALGANAFEAREKYVHSRHWPQSQRPSQPSSPAIDR